MCRLGWRSVRQREGCPALGQENGLWTFPAHKEMVLTVPEMQSQYISCEVGVVLLSEVGEGMSLPEGIVSRCREVLRVADFTYKLQAPRYILMPRQTPGGRWFPKWQNFYTRCDGDLAALPENFCSSGAMGTVHFHWKH